ncbi:MAG TPA: ABC transporter permease [Stellaceae bacterium]|nr:ABC transporter permease [Stellaceae bacterium]
MIRHLNPPGLLFLAALAGLWQAATFLDPSPTFPGFAAVVGALVVDRGELFGELGYTLLRAGAGFALALATMLPLGILLGRVRALGDVVEPVIELVRPLPPIAIIPVSMIFLGIGDAAKIAVVAYGASFPILINAIDAVRSLDPMLSHVARSLRLTGAERMRLVDLPAALPRIVAGIRLSIAVSLLLAVVAEMLLSTDGLGAFLVRAQESFRIDDVLAALLLIVLVALLVNLATHLLERQVLAWHHARGVVH